MPKDQSLTSEEVDFVLRALRQFSQPVSANKLGKAIPKSSPVEPKRLPEVLEHLVKASHIRVHRARPTVYWLPELEEQAGARIIDALNERPLTSGEFDRKFPSLLVGWPLAKRKEVLDKLVKAGQVRTGRGRSIVYWLPEFEEQASARIIKALNERPLTQTELESRYKNLLPGWPQAKLQGLVERLIKEKRIHKVASPISGAKLLSVRPQLTPQDCVRLAFHPAVTKLKSKGFTEEHIYAIAQELLRPGTRPIEADSAEPTKPPIDLEQLITERMNRLKPAAATGALVSLSDLRRSLATQISGKAAFDRAILQLAATGRFALHRHDFPSSLSQEERDALVQDEHGNYYIGIALRV